MPFNVSGMGAADVVAVFGADTSGFDRGLRDIESGMGRAASGIGGFMRSIGQGIGINLGMQLSQLVGVIAQTTVAFDNVFDTIRIGSGATGAVLEGLKENFRNVVADVPTSFEAASQAVTMLAQRTELTGPALEGMAKQVLELSRLTGTDLPANIAATTRMFQDWSIASDQQAGSLDKLFVASQQTGIGVTRLSELVVQFGAPLRSLGFTFEQSVAMMAKFEKEGVNITTVLSAMRIGLAKFASAGKDPAAAFAEVSKRIKEAATETEAMSIGMSAFGKRGGADMTRAILENRLNLEELIQKLSEGEGAIQRTADETDDFSEKLVVMKNKILLAAEPLANDLFNAVNKLIPAMEELGRTSKLAFEGMSEAANAFFADFHKGAGQAEGDAGDIGKAISSLVIFGTSGFDTLRVGIMQLAASVMMVGKMMVAAQILDWQGVKDAWQEGTTEIGRLGDEWQERLKAQSQRMHQIWHDTGETSARAFTEMLEQGMGTGLDRVLNTQISTVQAFQPRMKSAFRTFGAAQLSGYREGIEQKSPSGFEKDLDRITKAFIDFPEKVRSQVVPKLKDTGKQMVKDFRDAFNELLGVINDWATHAGVKIRFTGELLATMSREARANVILAARGFDELTSAIERMAAETIAGGRAMAGGVRDAFEVLINQSRKTADTIVAESTRINSTIIDLPIVYKDATGRAIRLLGELSNAEAETARRTQRSVDSMNKSIEEWKERNKRALEQIKEDWGEGAASIIISIGQMAGVTVESLTSWSHDIAGILETIPGHFGDMARGVLKTVDQWLTFANRVLGILSKLSGDIPSSLGGLISKIGGIFKGGADATVGSVGVIKNAVESIGGSAAKAATQAAQGLGSISTSAATAATGVASAAAGIASGMALVTGAVAAAQGAFALFQSSFHSSSKADRGVGGFLLGGPIGAIASIIWGGPTKEQKEAAERERQKFKAELEQTQAQTQTIVMETLEKARTFFEGLANFVAVPRKAIRKFFDQLQTVLEAFSEMAAEFKTESLAKSKEVAESLGPVWGFLMGAIDFSKAAREIEDVSDEAIERLMSAIRRIEAGFEKVVEELDKSTVARAARLATKLTTVFDFIKIIPDTLKGLSEAPDVTDEILAKVFANVTSIIDRFSTVIDATKDYAMSKLAKSSKQFAAVFEGVSAVTGALKSIGEYTPMSDAAFDAVSADFQKVIDAIAGWTAMGERALENALNLEDVVRRLRESLARSLSGLSSLMQGQASTAAAIRSQGSTVINRTDQSIHFGGGVSIDGADPRYEGLARELRGLFGSGGLGQIAQSH
jgi:phage-related minor tail protein